MLSRYTMYRRRPADAEPLPNGIRQDARFRTKHILRPPQDVVERYLANPTDASWKIFRNAYFACLNERFQSDPQPFENLARLASESDVYIGCSCPTKKNPDVRHCHTFLALEFMQKEFPDLEVVFPKTPHD